MQKYIWMNEKFPNFKVDMGQLVEALSQVKYRQGLLHGSMLGGSFADIEKNILDVVAEEIVRSSEIEGIRLDMNQVRSSVARRLGVSVETNVPVQRDIDGIVAMLMEATSNYNGLMSEERLFSWHGAMFPGGYSGLVKIRVGAYRDDVRGPMQIVSGPLGREKVYYQAPPAELIPKMMKQLFEYINNGTDDAVVKAAVAHLWFVIIHPFDDGNGRIARAISEMLLCRAEQSPQHLYTFSGTINRLRKEYYAALEITREQSLDITLWVKWFLQSLNQALVEAESRLYKVAAKNAFWNKYKDVELNARQRKVLEKLLDGFEGKLTSTKWAKICACSHDTASRDLAFLVDKGILCKSGAGRSVNFELREGR